ncbi:MAG TPA: sigma-70 family RNA polymerase sigma factor [Stellaceae bacterium]|nr:sigma-70 family RNA polymerase sigma factor [Stellaceae bacterium]
MEDLRQLIEAEIPRLRRYARALMRSRDRADDLVQDTIVRGLEKLHLYQPGTNLRAWLFTMMHNHYVNAVRRSARRGHEIEVEKVPLKLRPSQIERLELRDLERAIASLPDEQRTTLLLISLEGMKYEEVAQICDVPVGTVRSRLSRARTALHQMLEGDRPAPNSRPHPESSGGERDSLKMSFF